MERAWWDLSIMNDAPEGKIHGKETEENFHEYFWRFSMRDQYDAVSLIIANTWKVWEFRYCRIISDVVCVVLGTALYLLSGGNFAGLTAMVGVGTIITAFFMGPLIEYFNVHVARPFLNGK